MQDSVYVVDVVNGGMSPVSVKNMARGIVAVEDAIQKSFHDDTFSQEVIILEEWIAKAGSNDDDVLPCQVEFLSLN